MKFKHPVEIPRSKTILNFEWTGERVPCAKSGVKGDSHAMTWADDDCIYVGTGDPNWFVDGSGNVVTISWTPEELSDEMTVRRGCGLAVEKFTGYPENFRLERVNDMLDFVGGGGSGPKPSGMICVDGVLYFAAQNLLGKKPARFRPNSQHGSDATILASYDKGKTWTQDISGILRKLYDEQYTLNTMTWKTPPESRGEYGGWKPMFPGNLFGGPSFCAVWAGQPWRTR